MVVKAKYPFLFAVASAKHHNICYFNMLDLTLKNNIFLSWKYPRNLIHSMLTFFLVYEMKHISHMKQPTGREKKKRGFVNMCAELNQK